VTRIIWDIVEFGLFAQDCGRPFASPAAAPQGARGGKPIEAKIGILVIM
jgi:hypothetical protein